MTSKSDVKNLSGLPSTMFPSKLNKIQNFVSVLIFAHVERFSVSQMQDLYDVIMSDILSKTPNILNRPKSSAVF